MNLKYILIFSILLFSFDLALADSWGRSSEKGVTSALICDSDESCTHLAGVIAGIPNNQSVTIVLICDNEEECGHLSGVISNNVKLNRNDKVLPLRLLEN